MDDIEQRKSILEAIFFVTSFEGPGASITHKALCGEAGFTPERLAGYIEMLVAAGYVKVSPEDAYQITLAGISALRFGTV